MRYYKILFIVFSSSILMLGCVNKGYWKELPQGSYTYLTWKQPDIHHTITINFFDTHKKFQDLTILYDTQPHDKTENYTHQKKAFLRPLELAILQNGFTGPRNNRPPKRQKRFLYIYSCELENLQPNQTYYFRLIDSKTNYTTAEKKFSLPNPQQDLKIIVGGDMGTKPVVEKMLQHAAAKDPDLIIIGGDLAYVNGEYHNFDKWLLWLDYWQRQMVDSQGHIIPGIFAIGNHETNLSLFNPAPFYFGLFDQSPKSQRSYFTRVISDDCVVFVLDSNHVVSHFGKQQQWLEQQLQKHRDKKFKFAVYHVPFYPGHRSYDSIGSTNGRDAWQKLFEQYGVQVCFEHHDHVYKRSKLLLEGKVVSEGGILYIGDGSFGRGPRGVEERWYLEKVKSKKHFLYVELGNDIFIQAIDDEGRLFDQVKLGVKRQILTQGVN